jgi:hypothetical protein
METYSSLRSSSSDEEARKRMLQKSPDISDLPLLISRKSEPMNNSAKLNLQIETVPVSK